MKYPLLLGIVFLLFAGPTMGVCNVPQPRLVCAEYFASKVVVEASLTKARAIRGREDPEGVLGYFYTLTPSRVFRGQIDGVFRVYEGNDSGRATFEWKVGRKYVLFLFYSSSDKAWELDGCGNSGPASHAVLKQIDAIQSSHDESGAIHGVVSPAVLSVPTSGVRVEARGTNGVYTATTNAKGEFEIRVPAGKYVLRAIKKGFLFYAAEFSYENPEALQIEPGGCAQIQLDTSETSTSQPPKGR
jgi:hypothetical protein